MACVVSVIAYWAVNFHDPTVAIGYSIVLFTVGFVYSAGVWDSIYYLLFSLGCNESVSWFIMSHLLLYFWLFSGAFIVKDNMPLFLQYIGYYPNPVRLTLESQFCAILLPKTFEESNRRGSDILATTGYLCLFKKKNFCLFFGFLSVGGEKVVCGLLCPVV